MLTLVLQSYSLCGGQAAPGAQKTRSRLILDMPHHKASRHRKLEAAFRCMQWWLMPVTWFVIWWNRFATPAHLLCLIRWHLGSHGGCRHIRLNSTREIKLPKFPVSERSMEKRRRWTAAGTRTYNNSSPEDHYGPEDTGWGKRLSSSGQRVFICEGTAGYWVKWVFRLGGEDSASWKVGGRSWFRIISLCAK